MQRRIVRRVETHFEDDYDHEGNLFQYEVRLDMIYILQGSNILWGGTEQQAHICEGEATSTWLPPGCRELTPRELTCDAVWFFIAPLAVTGYVEHNVRRTSSIAVIREMGAPTWGQPIDVLPSRRDVFIETNPLIDQRLCATLNESLVDWVLLKDIDKVTLAQNCIPSTQGYSVLGAFFEERVSSDGLDAA